VSIQVQYFDMEQLLPQQERSSLSGGQTVTDVTQSNVGVTKYSPGLFVNSSQISQTMKQISSMFSNS